jgi:hypothetical protein
MIKEAEMTKDAPVKTIPSANPKKEVDAKVVKIMREKRSAFDGFDDTGSVYSRTSDDGDWEERVEV